ncbi:N-acetyltransferase family protein [Neobacillus sp. LXY-4]|uniref:GNAT family N-acetyltransferase n=1 Tax=Neobacillus sp. LXY-4 TaxID=3379826 RepID=UPI003EE04AC0
MDLHNVEIRRPKREDFEELNHFFRIVITDTFAKEGISELNDDLEKEIETKRNYLNSDLNSNGENRYFLIALENDNIIGSIEYGPANDMIVHYSHGELNGLVEVGTVFVYPNVQRQGLGNLLLKEMYETLHMNGIEEFCLDSGYACAQKIWKKKFGAPDYLEKNHWGEGFDYMIWRVRLERLLLRK